MTRMKSFFPLIEPIPYSDPMTIFSLVVKLPWSILLDSATGDAKLGRFSFIAFDPFIRIVAKDNTVSVNDEVCDQDPWILLKKLMHTYHSAKALDCASPLQGGFIGSFSYDLCHHFESIPQPRKNSLQFPDLQIGGYDLMLAFDHINKTAWIISTGFPEINNEARQERAQARLEFAKMVLQQAPERLPELNLAESVVENITHLTNKHDYINKVQQVIDYIYAGDIYQANLSQRYLAELNIQDSFTLYQRLRTVNPAPFSVYANYPAGIILSASPERFLKLSNNKVTTSPIKGTRPRGKSKPEDQAFLENLLQSKKDRAENIMIVDLLRNDLARVCKAGSVQVTQLCEVESYATVHHLVSTISAELLEQHNAIDLLQATFPGGSITGAPKIRAMEIINELEEEARGPFYGSIGYIGFDGEMDTSILIRTMLLQNNTITFQVGGGIVADSIPQEEYEETLVKARGLLAALLGKQNEKY